MKCLYLIAEPAAGGAVRRLATLAGEMQAMGHTVRVLALGPPGRACPVDPGLDAILFDSPPPHDPRCLFYVCREIRRFRPDVLHMFGPGFDLWPHLAGRLLGVPCVVSSRGGLTAPQTARRRWFRNAGNLLVDAVAADSRAAAEHCHANERFVNRGAVYAIPNALSPRPESDEDAAPLPPAAGRVIVSIADFRAGEGHDMLLRAFAGLADSVDASLWLAGEGDREAAVRSLALELGLADRVHFLGRRHDVSAVLARAALYVHASTLESSPAAVLNAMGQGVPVVAFARGGVPELLDGGTLGCLTRAGDEAGLANAMRWALAHPAEASAMAVQARGAVAARHAPREIARQHERLYRAMSRRPIPDASGDRRPPPTVAIYTVGDVRQPSTRYRALQYVPDLQASGARVTHFGLPAPSARRFASTASLVLHALRRGRQLRAAGRFDHVLVQKALTPSRWRGLLPRLTARARRFTYDIDDDVFDGRGCLPFRRPLNRLQNPGEAQELVRHASRVLAGNDELARECVSRGGAAVTMPTVVDCRRYWHGVAAGHRAPGEPLRLVWAGQRSTLPCLVAILPWLQQAASLLRGTAALALRVICDGAEGLDPARLMPLKLEFVEWSLDGEVDNLAGSHVGLMPLADDAWCRAKCGFKALQYMALGIPAIASPVGVNARIVVHGVTGYLAGGGEDWVRFVEALALDETGRRNMGRRARARVVAEYSLQRWAGEWVRQVTGGPA